MEIYNAFYYFFYLNMKNLLKLQLNFKKYQYMKNIYYLAYISFLFSLNLSLHDYDNPSATHILDAEVFEDLLIVVGMIGGIEFYDISNPQSLNHLTSFNLSSGGGGGGGGAKPNCVSIVEGYAYITTKNGVAIIDISNPSNPQSLGYISGTSNFILEDLDSYGDILAVSAHEDGVLIYDISNPSNPSYISTIETENAWAVEVDNYYLYVADGTSLSIYYETQENSIAYNLMSTIELSNAIKDLSVDSSGEYLYVAIGSDGVAVIDLMVNATPQVIDVYNTSAMANKIEVFDGNKVAVSDWDDVEILSLDTNESSLELVGYKNTTRRTMGIAVKDSYIYSAEWASVQSFEFGEIEGPDIDLSTYELNYPYIENGTSSSLSVDVTNNGNSNLVISSNYTTNSEFIVENPLAELAPGESQIVDIVYFANENNASGSYRIFSNDIDESEVICETNGNINGANIGQEAPDFNLDIVANGTGNFQLSDYLGSIVVIAFFAPN